MKKENLQRMVDLLNSGKVTQEMFDMNKFRLGDKKNTKCNSVGCVVGWCTELDSENIKENYIFSSGGIDFYAWSEYFTGMLAGGYNWRFLFSENWAEVDNTINGAIKRLEYVIKHGQTPEDWDFNEETIKFYNA